MASTGNFNSQLLMAPAVNALNQPVGLQLSEPPTLFTASVAQVLSYRVNLPNLSSNFVAGFGSIAIPQFIIINASQVLLITYGVTGFGNQNIYSTYWAFALNDATHPVTSLTVTAQFGGGTNVDIVIAGT